jgi:hypothetical protein
MKKIIFLLIIMTMITSANATNISSCNDLTNMQQHTNYELTTDLSCPSLNWTPIEYSGTFNGNNHTISGLTSNNTKGLFGILNGATIKNLRLEDIDFERVVNESDYFEGLGGLAALFVTTYEGPPVIIDNIHITGTLKGTNVNIGGLVGRTLEGERKKRSIEINNSSFNGEIYHDAEIFRVGHSGVGGLIGDSYNTKINNSSTSGKIKYEGDYYCSNYGGLIGRTTSGEINKSNSTMTIDCGVKYTQSDVTNGLIEAPYGTGYNTGTGTMHLGGLVGTNVNYDGIDPTEDQNVFIKESFYQGEIINIVDYENELPSIAKASIGGIVGFLVGKIIDSYTILYLSNTNHQKLVLDSSFEYGFGGITPIVKGLGNRKLAENSFCFIVDKESWLIEIPTAFSDYILYNETYASNTAYSAGEGIGWLNDSMFPGNWYEPGGGYETYGVDYCVEYNTYENSSQITSRFEDSIGLNLFHKQDFFSELNFDSSLWDIDLQRNCGFAYLKNNPAPMGCFLGDINWCGAGVSYEIPPTEPCVEDWYCGNWSDCNTDGYQTRNCTDLNNCGTTNNKPNTTKTCTYQPPTTLNECTGTEPPDQNTIKGFNTYTTGHQPTTWTYYPTQPTDNNCTWTCKTGYTQQNNTCIEQSTTYSADQNNIVLLEAKQENNDFRIKIKCSHPTKATIETLENFEIVEFKINDLLGNELNNGEIDCLPNEKEYLIKSNNFENNKIYEIKTGIEEPCGACYKKIFIPFIKKNTITIPDNNFFLVFFIAVFAVCFISFKKKK